MSASGIGWIVSVAFVVCLVSGFFVGFWRGLKRSSVNLGISVIGALIAFFITPPISNAILGINITISGTSTTIGDFLVTQLQQNPDISNLIAGNPNLELFFKGLPGALVNVVVFILLTCIVELVLYIFYKVIAVIFLKKQEGEKKHRLWGGCVGLAKTLVIALFAFMPFASLIGIVTTVDKNQSYFVETETTATTNSKYTEFNSLVEALPEPSLNPGDENIPGSGNEPTSGEETNPPAAGGETPATKPQHLLDSVLPKQAKEIFKGLENNMLTKMSHMFGMDDLMFDYLAKVKIDGKDIAIRKEITNIYPIADYMYQLSTFYDANGTINYKNTNFDKIQKNFKDFYNGPMFETIISSTISDIIINYDKYSFIPTNLNQNIIDVLNQIKTKLTALTDKKAISDYFINDVDVIFNTFKDISSSGFLDEFIATKGATNKIDMMLSEKYIANFTNTVKNLFSVNLVKDSIDSLAKMLLTKFSDLDVIDVDTSLWTKENWDSLANSIVDISKTYSKLSKEISVSIQDIISNPSQLLDQTSTVNIETSLNLVGQMIDQLRNINLLKNSQGISIFDKMFKSLNLDLPTQPVIKETAQGTTNITIDTYTKLFDFISPVLTKIKTNNVYQIITTSQNPQDIVTGLANIVVKDKNFLADIILPLNQLPFTKTLVIDPLIQNMDSTFIDMSVLTSYELWKNDLAQISDLFANMTNLTVDVPSTGDGNETKTYLSLIMEGNFDLMMENIKSDDISLVFKPILYAKSMTSVRTNLFNNVATMFDQFTSPARNNLDITKITLEQGNKEDQADEICVVLQSLINLTAQIAKEANLKNIIENETNRNSLGNVLVQMQTNAYRNVAKEGEQTALKTEEGLFKGVFVNIMRSLRATYDTQLSLAPELSAMFNEDNLQNLDIQKLLTGLSKLASLPQTPDIPEVPVG